MDTRWRQRGRRLWQGTAIAITALCTWVAVVCLHTMSGMMGGDFGEAVARDPWGTISFTAASFLPGFSMLAAVVGRIICKSIPSFSFVLLMTGGAAGYLTFMLQLFR